MNELMMRAFGNNISGNKAMTVFGFCKLAGVYTRKPARIKIGRACTKLGNKRNLVIATFENSTKTDAKVYPANIIAECVKNHMITTAKELNCDWSELLLDTNAK